MENASKALLIAGGILIALIIITIAIMGFAKIKKIQNDQMEQVAMEQLNSFNAEFEAYNKKIMYGTDVITLINKVVENNKTYKNDANYSITLMLNGVEIKSSASLIGTDVEKTLYTCNKIQYNSTNGRISRIEIKTR